MVDTSARHHVAPAPYGDGQSPLIDRVAFASSDTLLLAARILLGVIFLTSGYGKLTGLEGFAASLTRQGVPMVSVFAPLGAAVECFGGLALILGIATRYVALLMILFVIVATAISHRYWQLTDAAAIRAQQTQFFKNVTIIGGYLALFVAGPGRFSVDGLLRRNR